MEHQCNIYGDMVIFIVLAFINIILSLGLKESKIILAS